MWVEKPSGRRRKRQRIHILTAKAFPFSNTQTAAVWVFEKGKSVTPEAVFE
jgi:hypothetical protein